MDQFLNLSSLRNKPFKISYTLMFSKYEIENRNDSKLLLFVCLYCTQFHCFCVVWNRTIGDVFDDISTYCVILSLHPNSHIINYKTQTNLKSIQSCITDC